MRPSFCFVSVVVVMVFIATLALLAVRGNQQNPDTIRHTVNARGEKQTPESLIRPFLMMQFEPKGNHPGSKKEREASILANLPFPAPWGDNDNSTSTTGGIPLDDRRHRQARRKKNGSLFFRNAKNNCQTLHVAVKKKDITDNIIISDFGHAFRVDFFINNEKAGDWYENVIYTEKDGTAGSGTISVVFNKNSAIALNGVVNQRQLPITGGSGVYQRCPGGYAQPVQETKTKVRFQFNLCEAC